MPRREELVGVDEDLEAVPLDDEEEGEAPDGRLTNGDLARIFHDIGDMLEVKGELRFKTVAYHRAADAIGRSAIDLVAAYRAGETPRVPGVGAAISDKIRELATTGRMAYYDRLRAEIPPTLVEIMHIPGVGPKTVKQLHEQLGIESLEDLKRAAEAGTLRDLRGMSSRTEQLVLEGIARLEANPRRLLLNRAEASIVGIAAALEALPGVRSVVPAGSFRRRKETIGDLDLLVETDAPGLVLDTFTGLGVVDQILNRGPYKAAVRLLRGPQVDLMVMPPGEAGTYLIHFTGSKEHNVKLRARARDRGWSLSEKGYLRIDLETGEPLTGDAAELRTFPTEQEAYAFLDLPYIEPELREDEGEIEAALAGRLPHLVELGDLRGDLHTHSEWSDGVQSIEVMAEAARRRGYAYQVLTDHSISLAIARGLAPDRVEQQRSIIAELNARFEQEEREGTAPAGDAARRLPPPPRLRAGDPYRWRARLPRRAARPVRPRRRVAPRRAPPAARPADAADAQRDPQPARRRDRPPVGPHDPDPRRSRPRLGHGVRGGRPDRHGPRDERLAAPARPVG